MAPKEYTLRLVPLLNSVDSLYYQTAAHIAITVEGGGNVFVPSYVYLRQFGAGIGYLSSRTA